jgi:cardiolipin synthase
MSIDIDVIRAVLVALVLFLAVVTCIHAMLNKPDPRGAALWIVICLLFPLGGVVLYLIFGINRINRRAQRRAAGEVLLTRPVPPPPDAIISSVLDYDSLIRTTRRVTALPLVADCQLHPLFNGDQAFPEMLAAIEQARSWIYLSSYIFDYRGVGGQFIDQLAAAQRRGVEVRVIIDGIGEWYDGGKTRRRLRKRGVNTQTFLPPRLLPPQLAINLRNHRKLLLVDGTIGFVGGINIRPQHTHRPNKPLQIQDLAVKMHGPILEQLTQVAVDDWRYVTGEQWTPALPRQTIKGSSFCRTIPDGPEQALEKLLAVLLAAIARAHHSVCIMTPYFLPPRELDAMLRAAALSGVDVTVILPAKSDHSMVHWASLHRLPALIDAGINIFFQPPPFAHTKLLVIDDSYVQFGSSNIDARSLRLNFELVVESFDTEFTRQMTDHIEQVLHRSRRVEPDFLRRSWWKRVRNAACWLFSPNL